MSVEVDVPDGDAESEGFLRERMNDIIDELKVKKVKANAWLRWAREGYIL